MATHSIILAWRIPWTEEPGGPQSMGLQRADMTDRTTTAYMYTHTHAHAHTHACFCTLPEANRKSVTQLSRWVTEALHLQHPAEGRVSSHAWRCSGLCCPFKTRILGEERRSVPYSLRPPPRTEPALGERRGDRPRQSLFRNSLLLIAAS